LRSALIAAMVGLPILAATPVTAKPIEANENSVQVTVDSFVAYLKSETNQALTIAARMARDNKDSLAAARAYLDNQISAWRDLLSDRKATPGTLGEGAFGKDASATWQAWRQAAVSSWATIERSAHDVVDWIATWMRHLSLSHQNPETPV